jgi:Ca2+-binding EF-hand superfamily protein
MSKKKEILKKVKLLITQSFDNPEDAFSFFDKNEDGKIEKRELKKLIRAAEVSRFISGIAAGQMLKGLDGDEDEKLDWQEFKKGVKELLA